MKYIFSNLKPVDWFLFVFCMLFSIFLIISPLQTNGTKKLVLVLDGKQTVLAWKTGEIDLKDHHGKNILIEVENYKARVRSSDCPDQICVHTGWISGCGEVAACLPNKAAILIKCGDGDYNDTLLK